MKDFPYEKDTGAYEVCIKFNVSKDEKYSKDILNLLMNSIETNVLKENYILSTNMKNFEVRYIDNNANVVDQPFLKYNKLTGTVDRFEQD